MIESLEKLSETKVKLSVPLIASFITKRYRQSDIARACNVSDQAVSSYIKKHYAELLPLVDTSDGLSAMMSKHTATKAAIEQCQIPLPDRQKQRQALLQRQGMSSRSPLHLYKQLIQAYDSL